MTTPKHGAGSGITPGATVSAFIKAVASGNFDEARSFLSPETVFDNVPQEPPAKETIGADAICHRLSVLIGCCEKSEWEVIAQVEQGDTVFNERIDRFWFKPGMFPKSNLLEWPVATRWVIKDGRIHLWRDYYELHLTEKQLGVNLVEFGKIVGNNYGRD